MKVNKKTVILSVLVSLIPLIMYGVMFSSLPEQIPTSFDLNGNIRAYTEKPNMIFLLLMPPGIVALLTVVPRIDPRKKNYEKFAGLYGYFLIGMVAFFSILLSLMLIAPSYPDLIHIDKITPAMIGVLFLIIGNYMPRIKQTYTMGIKTPWTLDNEVVWDKTHRLGGYCFIIAGVLMLLTAVYSEFGVLWSIFIFLILFIPIVMSYFYHKEEMKRHPEEEKQ